MTRIKDTSNTATSAASDDYVLLDGATNGSRKILASGVGGLSLISRTTTSSSASNVTFSSIPGTFTDLILTVAGRCDRSGQNYDDLRIQINADTGANYDGQYLHVNGSTVSAATAIAAAFVFTGFLPGPTGPANLMGALEATFPAYANTALQKFFRFRGQLNQSNASGGLWLIDGHAWYRSTSAITSIKVYPAASNFVNGSVLSLYGRV